MTVGPDVTSVNILRFMTDSDLLPDISQSLTTSVNNERKRKTKLNAAEEINGELSARKKIKISIVPAVNLYD